MSGGTNRYSNRVDLSYLESLEARAEELHKGHDSYRLEPSRPVRRRRLSSQRLSTLRQALSPRDQAVLESLQDLRLATTTHIQSLHFHEHTTEASGRRVANRVLNRLRNQELASRLQRRIGGIKAGSAGQIYSLAPAGHRLLGEPTRKRLREPSSHHVRHTLAITDLYVQLMVAARDLALDDLAIETEPTCWRLADNTGIPATLKPDLYACIGNSDTELSWFIEVDCDTESGSVITRKLAAYVAYWQTGIEQQQRGVFPRTLWITPDAERAAFIQEIINTTSGIEPALFETATTAEAVDILTDFSEPDHA